MCSPFSSIVAAINIFTVTFDSYHLSRLLIRFLTISLYNCVCFALNESYIVHRLINYSRILDRTCLPLFLATYMTKFLTLRSRFKPFKLLLYHFKEEKSVRELKINQKYISFKIRESIELLQCFIIPKALIIE